MCPDTFTPLLPPLAAVGAAYNVYCMSLYHALEEAVMKVLMMGTRLSEGPVVCRQAWKSVKQTFTMWAGWGAHARHSARVCLVVHGTVCGPAWLRCLATRL